MQSIIGVCEALKAACDGLFSPAGSALVCVGPPGDDLPDLIVALMDWRAPVERPTMGTNRSRESKFEIDLIFSAFVAGGPEVQLTANANAWSAAEQLEAWLRQGPNATLGGACRDAWISNKVLTPEIAWETPGDMNSAVPVGRTGTATVTITAAVRY